ncbi:pyridoxine 5'-phosphate oxidase C-terminal domain-containing protein, partial [Streptomyces sp. NPDC001274]
LAPAEAGRAVTEAADADRFDVRELALAAGEGVTCRLLLARYEELAARYPEGEQVPAPPHWGGFRVVPDTIEFWQGHENRLHDRLRYVREGEQWRVERLCP